jgi:hypothetical protein
MKTMIAIVLAAAAISAAALNAQSADPQTSDGATDFPYVVPFELGNTAFASGDNITITSLRGTRDVVTTNEVYCVEGTYTLASHSEANLCFFATVPNSGPSSVDPRQTVRITNGFGTFKLIKTMSENGYLHVTFYSVSDGNNFGGVYFGEGDWVLRDKPQNLTDVIGGSSESATASAATNSGVPQASAAANQAIYAYLGDPVPAPANIDPAYTKEGLTQAVDLAAGNAGVTLKQLVIDDSEFPFVVGVQTSQGGLDKLVEQFRKLATPYEYGGSVSGRDCGAFNLVPYSAYPRPDAERIGHRLTVRYEVVYDRLIHQQ